MKIGKQYPRRVIKITPDSNLMRQGKPRWYWYRFECGHDDVYVHDPHKAIPDMSAIETGKVIRRHCYQCQLTGSMYLG